MLPAFRDIDHWLLRSEPPWLTISPATGSHIQEAYARVDVGGGKIGEHQAVFHASIVVDGGQAVRGEAGVLGAVAPAGLEQRRLGGGGPPNGHVGRDIAKVLKTAVCQHLDQNSAAGFVQGVQRAGNIVGQCPSCVFQEVARVLSWLCTPLVRLPSSTWFVTAAP